MDVDDPVREAVEEPGRQQVHVAGEDDQATPCSSSQAAIARSRPLAAAYARELEDGGRDPGRARPCERRRSGPVRGDRADRQAGVDQRLQVRALPGDEHADHSTLPPITRRARGPPGTTAQ